MKDKIKMIGGALIFLFGISIIYAVWALTPFSAKISVTILILIVLVYITEQVIEE